MDTAISIRAPEEDANLEAKALALSLYLDGSHSVEKAKHDVEASQPGLIQPREDGSGDTNCYRPAVGLRSVA
jgi:hypothetical protein